RALARVSRPGARLALFHPIGRAALARRHDRALRRDELLDPSVRDGVLAATGWTLDHVDDGDDRYLALAYLSSASAGMHRPAGGFDFEAPRNGDLRTPP